MTPAAYLSKIRSLFLSGQSRSRAVLYLALIFLVILIIPLFVFERSLKSSLDSHKQKHKDLIVLSSEYRALKEKVESAENKASNLPAGGIASAVNDISASLGVKGKIKSVKGISNRQLKGNISEEAAEVSVEKVSMNELINIFHKIETMPAILSVRKTTIKKSFEKPDLLDVTISLALFNLQPEAKP